MATFKEALNAAVTILRAEQAAVLVVHKPGIYDTGAGGAEHSARIEERRRANAQADNDACRLAAMINAEISELTTCQDYQAYEACLDRRLRNLGLRGQVQSLDNIDWRSLRSTLRNGPPRHLSESLDRLASVYRTMRTCAVTEEPQEAV